MLDIKNILISKAIEKISHDLDVLRRASEETHANSTSEETKAEGKYDTRGIEASYLAEAQAEQVRNAEAGFNKLQSLEPEDEPDSVLLGSLVVISSDDEELNYLILPTGGGLILEYQGETYLVITPNSPIGKKVLGVELGTPLDSLNQANAYISEIY